MKPKSIDEYLAEQIKLRREQRELRQEDLAVHARALGLDWMRDTVAAIETGRRKLTTGELYFLPVILQIDSPADLFSGKSEDLEIAPGLVVTSQSMMRMFSLHRPPKVVRKPSLSKVVNRGADRQAAEIKAARKLSKAGLTHVDPNVVMETAHRLWGCSLTRKRDIRVSHEVPEDLSPRSLQAKRGLETRKLIEELRLELQKDQLKPKRKFRLEE